MKNKLVLLVLAITLLCFPKITNGQAPDLGLAYSFALFTSAGAFNNVGTSVIIGDIGTNVGAFTGFPPGVVVGQIHVADIISAQVAADVNVAYAAVAGLTCGAVIGTTLGGGQILTPNIYCTGAATTLNGNLTLDAQGNPGAIFVFQIDGALTTATFANVLLVNGANVCNVYWQVNGAFALGGGSNFVGTLLINGAISLHTGARLDGRALSTAGAISTDDNFVFLEPCCTLAPPEITCPGAVTVACASLVPASNPASVTVTVFNPGGFTVVFVSDVISNQTCANRYTITRTYLATDGCDNTATCTQTITVLDNTAPSIICPAAVVVSCANLVPAPNTASVTVGADNCGGTPIVTFVGDVISNLTCENRYTITRTYQAADACGNIGSCVQLITVFDNSAPTIICPAPLTVQCASQVPVPNTASVTVGTDNCGGIPIVTFVGDVISNQTCVNRYTITRTYRVADACGNFTNCTQLITVFDNSAPTIICPAPLTVPCAGQVPAPNTAGVTVGTDNCGGTPIVTFVGDVISNQTCANRFTITRTYRVADACGNFTNCTQLITVLDNSSPTIICPAPLTVQCAGQVPAPNTASVTVGTDNCGGTPIVTFLGDVISNQTCENRYTITRTYRVADVCGNFTSCSQIITVFDNTAPVFLNVPPNLTLECTLAPPLPLPLPTAMDNCTSPVTVILLSQTQISGICPILYTLNSVWRATDACGNSATVSQIITIQDTYAPQFVIAPPDVILECNLITNGDAFQDWLDSNAGATVFDCSPVTWSYMDSPFFTMPSTCGGTFQRFIRFFATDACGNSSFQDAGFTVTDMTPPAFDILPENLEVECMTGYNGEVELSIWLENFGGAQASDNCGEVKTEVVFLSEKKGCGSTYTRTYQFRATDECGNTNFVTATFKVVDNEAPVIDTCPVGNVFLHCEFDVPPPNTAGVIAYDNCSAVTISVVDTFRYGVGCVYSPLTVSYTYAVADACGNVTTCYQSFQAVDSIPPVYTGPDTLYVNCVSDLPGIGEVLVLLAPFIVDNCYDIVCIGDSISQQDSNSLVYMIMAKDLCGNWGDKFMVTFVANGNCKPLCTAPQSVWGNTEGAINGITTTAVINAFLGQYGGVTAGKLGKTITATSAACIQSILPGSGNTSQLNPGVFEFNAANNCIQPPKLMNADGTLRNKLAANVLAMELNMGYNLAYNDRNLGAQALAQLPICLIDPIVLGKVETNFYTVQGLVKLSNDYLAGVGYFPPNFGNLLNDALDNLNNYWANCQINDPCSVQQRQETQHADNITKLGLSPNPVTDLVTLNFEIAADAEINVRFVGSAGVQSEGYIQGVKGNNSFSFSTKNFPAGVYTVVFQYGQKLKTLRMVKVGN